MDVEDFRVQEEKVKQQADSLRAQSIDCWAQALVCSGRPIWERNAAPLGVLGISRSAPARLLDAGVGQAREA